MATKPPIVREFLYVDIERTRSMLAQLEGGILEQIRNQTLGAKEGGVSASLFGIGANVGATSSSSIEESRSLQDSIFSLFEESADNNGFITDLPSEFHSIVFWNSGAVYDWLTEGQLVRITCDLEVIDSQFIASRIESFGNLAESIATMSSGSPNDVNPPKNQRKKIRDYARKQMWGETDPDSVQQIAKFIESFFAKTISVRLLPCGTENRETAFVANLADTRENMEQDRERLLGRYGSRFVQWTTVFQIAALPPTDPASIGSISVSPTQLITGDTINRSEIERVALSLISVMESMGVAGGPKMPSITITPIGIYRPIPRSPANSPKARD